MNKVENIMDNLPVICERKDTLRSVAKKMFKDNIAHVAIVDKERRFLGMISDRDVTLALGKNENLPTNELTVNDAMINGTQTVNPDDNIVNVLRIMRKTRLKCLPVVDNRQRLKGIVSLKKIVKKINGIEEDIKN